MLVYYTPHALIRMRERGILDEWVLETIKRPDTTVIQGRKRLVIRKINGFSIAVVYRKEKYIRVITTYYL